MEEEFLKMMGKVETIFKEEMGDLHRKVIDGSPVDKGRFKTSWQLLDYDPKKLTFRLYNPVKYGLALWRYEHSSQGWSPAGGDILVHTAEENLVARFGRL